MHRIRNLARKFKQASLRLLATAFEAMSRYPYDLSDLRWDPDLFLEAEGHEERGGHSPDQAPQLSLP